MTGKFRFPRFLASANTISGRLRPESIGENCRVEKGGFVRWRTAKIFVSHALHGEYVTVFACDDGRYEVSFGPIVLGTVTVDRPELRLTKRPRVLSLKDEEQMIPEVAAA